MKKILATLKKAWQIGKKYYPIVRDFIVAILGANEIHKL